MSATRIKLSPEKYSAWTHKQQQASTALPQTVEMTRILRDGAGNVHTPNGYLSQEAYEDTRAKHPHIGLPEHSAIPFLDELNDADEADWQQHVRWADDGGPEVEVQ